VNDPDAPRELGHLGPGPASRWSPLAWHLPRRSRRTRRRAIVFAVLAGLGTLLILLTIDGLWSARSMIRGVTAARSHLNAGAEAVVTGDPPVAAGSFLDASDAAAEAIDAAGHPAMRLAGLLPFVGNNLDGVVAVARAEQASAEAGLVLVDAAQVLDWNDILLPATTSLGDVDLSKIRRAGPLLDEVATQLRNALDGLEGNGDGLVGPVATGYDDAVATLERRAALAGDAARLARLLPGFLGGDGTRRYVVAVQRLGQPAPAGGTIGGVGVLTATDGAMSMGPLGLPDPTLAAATASSRGPDVAAAVLAAASQAGLGPLDGVVLTDTVGLQELLWMTGDVEVAGRKEPLRFETAIPAIEREPFLRPDRAAGEERQAELGTEVLDGALGRRPSTEAFATASSAMAADRHLALFSSTKREQALIRHLGVAGMADPGRNPLAWTATSTASNLAGTYARWVTTQTVMLAEDGSAKVKTTVELRNRAPDGPPSALLGRAFGRERVGAWSADVQVILPSGAKAVTGETSTPTETVVGEDGDGTPYLEAGLAANPGSAMSLIVSYQHPAAALLLDGEGTYRMRVVPQPLAFPGVVRLRIVLPDGTNVLDASEEFERGTDVVRFEGSPSAPIDLFVRYG
jgi:hypothetical protein